MPDVYLCIDGVPIWLELKLTKTNRVKVSKSQIAWHSSHSRCGGVSFFLLHDPSTSDLFLFEGGRATEVGAVGLDAEPLYRGRDWSDLWDKIRESGFGTSGSGFGNHRASDQGAGTGAPVQQ